MYCARSVDSRRLAAYFDFRALAEQEIHFTVRSRRTHRGAVARELLDGVVDRDHRGRDLAVSAHRGGAGTGIRRDASRGRACRLRREPLSYTFFGSAELVKERYSWLLDEGVLRCIRFMR